MPSRDAIARRLGRSGQAGTPVGPSGGAKRLAPGNAKRAGSMFKGKPKGKLAGPLGRLPNPR